MGASAWTKSRRVWLRSRANDTQGKAGRLYETLLASVLGCRVSERGNPEYADIFSNELQIRAEVKSRGDVNSLEIRTHQIREYESDIPFPLEYTLYALVHYQSTRYLRKGEKRPKGFSEDTHRISLLRNIRSDAELNEFFATHIQSIHLLDLRVIKGLEKHLGTRTCRMVGRSEESAVSISRTAINDFFGDVSFGESLKRLGLAPQGFAKGVYPMHVGFGIDGQTLVAKFNLVTVLRRRLHAEMATVLAQKTLTPA
jgi:hypothetical protein